MKHRKFKKSASIFYHNVAEDSNESHDAENSLKYPTAVIRLSGDPLTPVPIRQGSHRQASKNFSEKQIWISMDFQELWEPWISPFIMTSETSNILIIKQKLP